MNETECPRFSPPKDGLRCLRCGRIEIAHYHGVKVDPIGPQYRDNQGFLRNAMEDCASDFEDIIAQTLREHLQKQEDQLRATQHCARCPRLTPWNGGGGEVGDWRLCVLQGDYSIIEVRCPDCRAP